MGWLELFLTGVGLSMDAFAVAMCKGLRMRTLDRKRALLVGLFFGGFQALMPLIGWLLGRQFEHLITNIDHWVVFALLGFIGGKMIFDALHGGEEEDCSDSFSLKELTLMALATSIDALAVGISFAFLQVEIFSAIATIGVTTFVLSIIGVVIGCRFGVKYRTKATLAGGIILILIGIKILLEHLGVLGGF